MKKYVILKDSGCPFSSSADFLKNRTVQVSMPRSSVVILTDPVSKFQIRKKRTSIMPIKGDYSRGNLMLQRIISYIVGSSSLNFNSFDGESEA